RPVRDDRRLGHLEAEEAGRETGLVEGLEYEVADPAVRELAAGEVDPRHEAFGDVAAPAPLGRLGTGLAENEGPALAEQAVRAGDRNEAAGGGEAAGRRVPAHKGLGADDRSVRELHRRLVVDGELAAVETEPQVVLEADELSELARHLVVENLVA